MKSALFDSVEWLFLLRPVTGSSGVQYFTAAAEGGEAAAQPAGPSEPEPTNERV